MKSKFANSLTTLVLCITFLKELSEENPNNNTKLLSCFLGGVFSPHDALVPRLGEGEISFKRPEGGELRTVPNSYTVVLCSTSQGDQKFPRHQILRRVRWNQFPGKWVLSLSLTKCPVRASQS